MAMETLAFIVIFILCSSWWNYNMAPIRPKQLIYCSTVTFLPGLNGGLYENIQLLHAKLQGSPQNTTVGFEPQRGLQIQIVYKAPVIVIPRWVQLLAQVERAHASHSRVGVPSWVEKGQGENFLRAQRVVVPGLSQSRT